MPSSTTTCIRCATPCPALLAERDASADHEGEVRPLCIRCSKRCCSVSMTRETLHNELGVLLARHALERGQIVWLRGDHFHVYLTRNAKGVARGYMLRHGPLPLERLPDAKTAAERLRDAA